MPVPNKGYANSSTSVLCLCLEFNFRADLTASNNDNFFILCLAKSESSSWQGIPHNFSLYDLKKIVYNLNPNLDYKFKF